MGGIGGHATGRDSLARGRELAEEFLNEAGGVRAGEASLRIEHEPVGDHGNSQFGDVLGLHELVSV